MANIVVTVGPSSIELDVLNKLLLSGADKFRINLSHSTKESLTSYTNNLLKLGISPAVDTQGQQLRVVGFSSNLNNNLGTKISLLFNSNDLYKEEDFPYMRFNHPEAFNQIDIGDIIKVDFDGLALRVLEKKEKLNYLNAEVISKGNIILNRAVDVQSKLIKLSSLTEFDKYALNYSFSKGCKEVYASFISSKDDILKVRDVIGQDVKLISKIETARGVANVKEIIENSDEILIDRGDLSREISIPAIPMAVFNILKIAKSMNKPVNIATNVLDSMMTKKIPSRAEISDIFSHLSAGASGIVLAAEVAIGDNPVSSTALLKYVIDLFDNFENGLHGIGKINKPSKNLIGEELYNWL